MMLCVLAVGEWKNEAFVLSMDFRLAIVLQVPPTARRPESSGDKVQNENYTTTGVRWIQPQFHFPKRTKQPSTTRSGEIYPIHVSS
mmetsp:Transcript_1804/g.4354  ORF Transcript_1804/g.4354 Transcript_1804/m.4354 type:complete len:86 (+) Transcript_1804:547-804(+)